MGAASSIGARPVVVALHKVRCRGGQEGHHLDIHREDRSRDLVGPDHKAIVDTAERLEAARTARHSCRQVGRIERASASL